VDKRTTPRFKLDATQADSAQVLLTLPQGEVQGLLLDISSGGFQFRINHIPQPPKGGTPVSWTLSHDGHQASGQGRITRVDTRLDHSATVGVAIDSLRSPDRGASFASLARRLASHEESGAVKAHTRADGKSVVEVLGKLNPRLNRDFTNLLRARPSLVDLSRCQQIDSGGLGLLLLGMERGLQVQGCKGMVKELADTAGICKRCKNLEACWDRAQGAAKRPGVLAGARTSRF